MPAGTLKESTDDQGAFVGLECPLAERASGLHIQCLGCCEVTNGNGFQEKGDEILENQKWNPIFFGPRQLLVFFCVGVDRG